MGYRMIDLEKLYEIYRRYHGGHKKVEIAKLGYDRKTIAKYIAEFERAGLTREAPSATKEEFVDKCSGIASTRQPRNSAARNVFESYVKEIEEFVFDPDEPMKPKTAFQVLQAKHDITASYGSFKRFFKGRFPDSKNVIIRIELPPGRELQMDYGKVGTLYDPASGKRRNVHAFIGVLSCSRLPYVEFVFTQNQTSFTESFVQMFEFYGGVAEFISIDNLKTGVIKPHLYDPQINKSFQEMAEYYNTFIDPCRVGVATDKGKVERLVPVARELFRKLKAIYPDCDISQLNSEAMKWSLQDYGLKEHGTTGRKPLEAFESHEREKLRPLPDSRFEMPLWKEVKVHPDQFIQFEKKRYSLPSLYRGRTLWARKKGRKLAIFDNSSLIREYLITGKNVTYTESDFPEVVREMMNGGYPAYLIREAEKYGSFARLLIETVLSNKAYLNARRAQGMLQVLDNYADYHKFDIICSVAKNRKIKNPRELRRLFESDTKQSYMNFTIPRGEIGESMLRDPDYYFSEED